MRHLVGLKEERSLGELEGTEPEEREARWVWLGGE